LIDIYAVLRYNKFDFLFFGIIWKLRKGKGIFMERNDSVVLRETKYIMTFVAVLSILMQTVFAVIGKWDYTVLLGNILSGTFAVLNFFLMGKSVEKAVSLEEKEAKSTIKTSQSLRQLMLLVVAAVGALVPVFNIWATIVPLLFPRIAVSLRPLFGNNK